MCVCRGGAAWSLKDCRKLTLCTLCLPPSQVPPSMVAPRRSLQDFVGISISTDAPPVVTNPNPSGGGRQLLFDRPHLTQVVANFTSNVSSACTHWSSTPTPP